MNLNNFTIKSQEAIERAGLLAERNGQKAIENLHILKAMLEVDENVIPFLFKKLDVQLPVFNNVLDKAISSLPKVSGDVDQYVSRDASGTLQKAAGALSRDGDQFVSIEHILLAMLDGADTAAKILKDSGVRKDVLLAAIRELRKGSKVDSRSAEDSYHALDRYARNLNELARSGKLDPVIGRDDEIRRILQILSRRTKNNPILIGEPGTGKTAIAEGLAHRIIKGEVPDNLLDKMVYSLDMGALIAGAKYKGEFEERLKSVVKEVIGSDGEIVLFIDEIHTLVGAGAGEGAMDAANILKPALARGELRAIGATTLKEYQKYFEKDKALERRFQIVMVNEPDTLDAISILRGLKERYENHHHVRIRDEAIVAAVELSQRYISDRFLPDKAIDLIDEAASRLRLEVNSAPEPLMAVERKIRQLEIEKEAMKREKDSVKVEKLNKELANLNDEKNELKAKWQSEKQLVDRIQQLKSEIEAYRHEAELAESEGDFGRVAEIRYGKVVAAQEAIENAKNELEKLQGDSPMINEEVSSEEIADIVSKWTGVPVNRMLQSEREKLLNLEGELHKRIVGQEEAIGAVSDAIRRSRAGLQDAGRPIGSFIFLGTTGVGKTELAKALAEFMFNDENAMVRIDMSEYQERHAVSRLIGAPPGYVGYDESGQLTEAVRRKPYAVVLLDEIEKAHPDVFNILLQVLDDGRLTDNKGRTVDFRNTLIIMTSNIGSHLIQERISGMNNIDHSAFAEEMKAEVFGLLKKTIRPEFLNRIDELIMFTPLSKGDIREIVLMQLNTVAKMLNDNGMELRFSDEAVNMLGDLGYDPQYGARPLKRVIQRKVLNELSRLILADKIDRSRPVRMDVREDELVIAN